MSMTTENAVMTTETHCDEEDDGHRADDLMLALQDNVLLQANPAADAEHIRSGGVIAVRIFFEVTGRGSFRAGAFNTANGAKTAFVKPGLRLRLQARPAAGARFSAWFLNEQFAGDTPSRTIRARAGLVIRAEFTSDEPEPILHLEKI